ncbi:MAG TPA: response regulator [Roseimicrobium sp.]|nr:response regulator [Roseimicrobium sp.]
MSNHPKVGDAQEPARRVRILFAEDDEDFRPWLVRCLRRAGYDVAAVSDGELAWMELCAREFDLFVTDNNMLGLSGLEVVERARQSGMGIPVLLISASVDFAQVHPASGLKNVVLLPKLTPLHLILAAIEELLRSSGQMPSQNTWR